MAKQVWPNLFLGGVGAIYAALDSRKGNDEQTGTTFAYQACINVAAEVCYDKEVKTKLTKLGVLCYNFRMMDDAKYNLEHAEEIVDLLHTLLSSGVKVLVHCLMGVSRSVSVVIRYLIRHQGFTYDSAFAHLRKHSWAYRPNSSFEKQLRASEMCAIPDVLLACIMDYVPEHYVLMDPHTRRRGITRLCGLEELLPLDEVDHLITAFAELAKDVQLDHTQIREWDLTRSEHWVLRLGCYPTLRPFVLCAVLQGHEDPMLETILFRYCGDTTSPISDLLDEDGPLYTLIRDGGVFAEDLAEQIQVSEATVIAVFMRYPILWPLLVSLYVAHQGAPNFAAFQEAMVKGFPWFHDKQPWFIACCYFVTALQLKINLSYLEQHHYREPTPQMQRVWKRTLRHMRKAKRARYAAKLHDELKRIARLDHRESTLASDESSEHCSADELTWYD